MDVLINAKGMPRIYDRSLFSSVGFLSYQLGELSFSEATRLIRSGSVTIGGAKVIPNEKIEKGNVDCILKWGRTGEKTAVLLS